MVRVGAVPVRSIREQDTEGPVYVATTKFQPTAFLQLGHLGKVSPMAKVALS
jgi:hypothetical protein